MGFMMNILELGLRSGDIVTIILCIIIVVYFIRIFIGKSDPADTPNKNPAPAPSNSKSITQVAQKKAITIPANNDASLNKGIVAYKTASTGADYAQAVAYFRESAKNGNPQAMYILGDCFYKGKGAPVSYDEAARLWMSAAREGNVKAQYNVGVCYYKGIGVEKDLDIAKFWLQKACDNQNNQARVLLNKINKK